MPFAHWFGDDVFNQMERLQRNIERLWSVRDPMMGHANVFPEINIYSNEEGYLARAELPGVKPDDIDISVTGKTLTVRGKRTNEPATEGEIYHRRERRAGEFRRAFNLPEQVEPAKVQAKFKNGVLEILLPRAEQATERKVQVNAG